MFLINNAYLVHIGSTFTFISLFTVNVCNPTALKFYMHLKYYIFFIIKTQCWHKCIVTSAAGFEGVCCVFFCVFFKTERTRLSFRRSRRVREGSTLLVPRLHGVTAATRCVTSTVN